MIANTDLKTLARSGEQRNPGLDSPVRTCACSFLEILGELAVLFCTNRSVCETEHMRIPQTLSCLLNTFKIDTINSVSPVSPQPPDSQQMLYLSAEEIRDISNADRGALKRDADFHHRCFRHLDLAVAFHRICSPLPKHASTSEYPWLNAGSVFFGHSPGPLDEIYAFPLWVKLHTKPLLRA